MLRQVRWWAPQCAQAWRKAWRVWCVIPRPSRWRQVRSLVAEFTDPGWTPLFVNAGGLILEVGGTLNHGAIVAREYGIPAVVGVRDATTRLSTGQRVRVDGNRGFVEVL